MPKVTRGAMQDAYNEVLARIMTLRLRPSERMDEFALAAEMGISRTPVREAMFRLASEGFVVSSRGGFRVRDFDLVDTRSLFEAHLIAAQGVAQLLALRVRGSNLEQLRELTQQVDGACAANDPAQISERNASLHILEAKLTGNNHLLDHMTRLLRLEQRLAYVSFGGDGALVVSTRDLQAHYDRTCADHHSHLAAIAAGDGQEAARIAAQHVRLFENRVVTMFTEGTRELESLRIRVA